MPIEMKDVCTISVQDFVKKLKAQNYADPKEALEFSLQYIARYNDQYSKCNINELLHAAKYEIKKLVAKNQITSKRDKDDEIDRAVISFIASPVKATSYYLETNKKLFDKIKEHQDDQNYSIMLKHNASELAIKLKYPQYANDFYVYEQKQSKAMDLISTLEGELPDSPNPIKNEMKKQKGGFFERVFRRTSNEYKAFRNLFKSHYTNPGSPLFGDNDHLKSTAVSYLKHKFPDLEDDQLPTESQIEELNGKGKDRAYFCLKVINAINEKEILSNKLDYIESTVKYKIDKYPWDNQKTLLEEQLEAEEKKENELINNNELEYDEKYNQLEVHDAQNIFKN